jgi:6-phosphogluconate dehydrogenase
MQVGVIGLGRMGGDMVRRLLRSGHRCVVFDRTVDHVQKLETAGATAAGDLADLVGRLERPRVVWLMLPAGEATEQTVTELCELLGPGDSLVDGGNSFYRDDIRRAHAADNKGIRYIDIGTSGGIWGLERGYCLTIGGKKNAAEELEPIFAALAPSSLSKAGEAPPSRAERGYLYCGPSGAGHFAKMIHNGIEYGLMQAYAEGFDILRHAGAAGRREEERYQFDLADVAEVWRRGSVIGSWLLDLIALALQDDPELSGFDGIVQDSGEGRWTVLTAIEEAVPADVLSAALYARFRSRDRDNFGNKLLSAMRNQFGGHVEDTGQWCTPDL